MKTRFLKILFFMILATLINSCATIFVGTNQDVNFNSTPSGAALYINGVDANKQTPCVVNIKRKVKKTEFNDKNQYNFLLKKEGYNDFLISEKAKFVYLSLLNIYWLGIPYLVDIPTGAIWKFEKDYNANLSFSLESQNKVNDNLKNRSDVPAESLSNVSKNDERPLSNYGKYYALIIGNNLYKDPEIQSLDEPIKDATSLYEVLVTKYTFDRENVIFLKNASYEQMIQAFDDLSNKMTKNDNLIVFYAGHGSWSETKNLGYWLPIDAKKTNTAFWIPNSRISDYMASIKSKHTLLIADACFSGSIFKTRGTFSDAQPSINKLYELPSKKAMTSGTLKEVPDKSVFLKYLVQRLKENNEKYTSSDMLFASFREAVLNNSPTEPQYGTIQNSGDEGGEFIFILK